MTTSNQDTLNSKYDDSNLILRMPKSEDGRQIHQLVAENPPLDPNSLYCNLLQCSHFAETCVVCEVDGQVVAFMTGYRKPSSPEVLFVWQMAVSESQRGKGLAGKMLSYLVDKWTPTFIETTVTESNTASAAVFNRFVNKRSVELNKSILFDRDTHFAGQHDSEVLYRIGPISY